MNLDEKFRSLLERTGNLLQESERLLNSGKINEQQHKELLDSIESILNKESEIIKELKEKNVSRRQ